MLPDNISVLYIYLFIYLYNQNTSIDFVKHFLFLLVVPNQTV